MAALQHDFAFPEGTIWTVVAYRQPDEETAARRWREIYDAHPRGNFSIWRTTTPDRSHWLLVLCGTEEALEPVEVPGEPFALDQASAMRFALRRTNVAVEAIQAGEREHVTQEGHYGPEGARIDDVGRIR